MMRETAPFHPKRAAIVMACTVALALTGCAGAPVELQAWAAHRLQSAVLEVTTQAAAGDYTAAQSSLDALQADLLTAASAGQATAARSARIQSAINLVSADLAAAVTAASTPPPASSTEAPVETPPADTVDGGPGNDGPVEGPENGNGNGNGNSGNNDKGNDKGKSNDKPGKGNEKPGKGQAPDDERMSTTTPPVDAPNPSAPSTDAADAADAADVAHDGN